MSVSQKPTLKLAPKLLITPALQQAIKLLQLTRLELEQVLRAELEVNPLLEVEDLDPEEQLSQNDALPGSSEVGGEGDFQGDRVNPLSSTASLEEVDLTELFANDIHDSLPKGFRGWDEDDSDLLSNVPAASPSMTEELFSQLRLLPIPDDLRPAAEFLVGNLEPDGYLRTPLPDLALQLGVESAKLEEALAWVQKLEPPGIGARDARECLLLQLDRMPPKEPEVYNLARKIVAEAFADLLKQDWTGIAERFGVDKGQLRQSVELLGKLPLHPGAALGPIEASTIEADVIVRKVNGKWQVELVDEGLPRVHLSSRYLQLLEKRKDDPEAADFVREKMRQAMWFLRAVEQRHSTVLRVARAIVRRQEEFFEQGLAGLKPMVLKDVADEIGMHESTISRVVQAKYMDTPRGLLPFKFFFHSSLSHALAGEVSSVAVKAKIRELILGEDPAKPLADARIARQLNRQGIRIARRTVAKYREEMGIPSSELRKRGKWLKEGKR
ncbi:MAG: RNA polymerase factor sigma-54 [Thermoanaerobaculaceae bacterium]